MVRGRRLVLLLALCILTAAPPLSALASDADELLQALQQARTLEARGQVQVTVLFPPRDVPTKTTGKLPVLRWRPAAVVKAFSVVRAGEVETVAGRPVTRFDLTPLNSGAGHWRLWVDRAWNIPLAFEERSASGQLARQAVFQKVNAKPVHVNAAPLVVPSGLRAAVLSALPGVRFPAGFTPVSVTQQDKRVEVTLSDGLNTLTLVLAPRNVKGAPGVASRQVGKRFVWLVGNMPSGTLNAVLADITQVNEGSLGTFLTLPPSQP